MRVFMLIMLLVVVIGIVGFISLNTGHSVGPVSLGFKITPNASLNAVVLWAFGLGVLWTLIIAIVQEIRLRTRISRLKNTIVNLEEELSHLRTMPLSKIETEQTEQEEK
ncbi:LapA family protein [bacterium]|nr:LapA family protein [bacterium]